MKKTENKNYISIVAQYFYGNRTGTQISRDDVDYFLRGDISGAHDPRKIPDVVRKCVRVPGTENVVIVYDQTQEDAYVNVEFPELLASEGAEYLARWGEELKMLVSCEIPEIGFKIHTRCFACRMDATGLLQSLENTDYERFIQYFPAR